MFAPIGTTKQKKKNYDKNASSHICFYSHKDFEANKRKTRTKMLVFIRVYSHRDNEANKRKTIKMLVFNFAYSHRDYEGNNSKTDKYSNIYISLYNVNRGTNIVTEFKIVHSIICN